MVTRVGAKAWNGGLIYNLILHLEAHLSSPVENLNNVEMYRMKSRSQVPG